MEDLRVRAWNLGKALAWIGAALLLLDLPWPFLVVVAPESAAAPLVYEGFYAALALGLSWLALRLEQRPLKSLGLQLSGRWLRQFGLGTLLGGGIILAAALAAGLLTGVRWRPGIPGLATLVSGGCLYFTVAWAEELHYRGYPFQRLCEAFGPWIAQALFAVYFVHAHWDNPGMIGTTRMWAALNIGLASLLLGYAWQRTGSLALSLGIHFGWNFVQGPLLGFGVSGTRGASILKPVLPAGGTWLHGGGFGLEAGLLCAISCLMAFILVARFPCGDGILDGKEQPCHDGS